MEVLGVEVLGVEVLGVLGAEEAVAAADEGGAPAPVFVVGAVDVEAFVEVAFVEAALVAGAFFAGRFAVDVVADAFEAERLAGVDFEAVDFEAVDFEAVDFEAVDFEAVDFAGVVADAGAFFAVLFVAELFVAVLFVDGVAGLVVVFAALFFAVLFFDDVAGLVVVVAALFFAVLFFDDVAGLVVVVAALFWAVLFFGAVVVFGVVVFGVVVFAGVVAAARARRGVLELVVVAARRAGVRTGRADASAPAEDGSRRVRNAADAPARSPCSSSGQRRTDCSRDEAALAWAPETSRPSTSRTTSRVRESTPSATVSERCTSCRAGSTGHLLRRSRHPGGHVVRSRYPAVPTSSAMESRHHCSLAPASRAAQIASSAARSASTPSPSTCSSPPWTAAIAEPRWCRPSSTRP